MKHLYRFGALAGLVGTLFVVGACEADKLQPGWCLLIGLGCLALTYICADRGGWNT